MKYQNHGLSTRLGSWNNNKKCSFNQRTKSLNINKDVANNFNRIINEMINRKKRNTNEKPIILDQDKQSENEWEYNPIINMIII